MLQIQTQYLQHLSPSEKGEIEALLTKQNPAISDDLEQIWYLLDSVWDEMGCDNRRLDWDKIGRFYANPVWLLNGLFIETHDISMRVRKGIADYIAERGFRRICDFGGGFGTLAREIAKANPQAKIDIYEPFPSQYGKIRTKDFSNIAFVDTLEKEAYDCLVSTDVLEHCDSVLDTFNDMLTSLKIGGEVLIGNCFYPVIKCHLPKHFHYRYSFRYVAQTMGVKFSGVIKNAEYVEIFKKSAENHITAMTLLGGGISKLIFYPNSFLRFCLRPLKRILKALLHSTSKF